MDPSSGYPESPMDQDELVYPCKGCGRILEEGKAFELSGNRWHIDCFRCNTCGTILDSDANLLLLGDGSLICNNCTYSCSVCNNKIEDLAILTGDQAFCATCFKCRNCKKKIENLKYARTSQGIFCMECHESLMQRRRKKGQKNGSNRHKQFQQAVNNTMLLDKSLPSLPPSAVNQSAFSPENESSPSETHSETPTELPTASHKMPTNSRSRSEAETPGEKPREPLRGPPKRPSNFRSHSSRSEKRERSPSVQEDGRKENIILPNSTYQQNRHSGHSDTSGNSCEGCFIPMALDPNPVPGPSPLTIRREKLDGQRDTPNQQQTESKPTARDYFNAINSASRKSPIDHKHTQAAAPSRDSPPDSRPPSQPNSPHIAYQERGRQLSTDFTDQARKNLDHGSISINAITHDSPRDTTGEEVRIRGNGELQNGKFTLQEAPKKKRNSQSDAIAPSKDAVVQPASQSASAPVPANNAQVNEHQVTVPSHESPSSSRSETTLSCSPRDSQFSRSHASTDSPKSHTSPLSTQLKTLPERGDSLGKPAHGKQAVLRRETDNSKTSHAVSHPEDGYDKPASAPPTTTTQSSVLASTSGNRAAVMAQNSPSTATCADVPPPPLRARERLALQGNSSSDSFTTPRAPPKPPNTANKLHQETPSVTKSDSHNEERPGSPRLRHPIGEQPIVDEELASTVNSEGPQEPSGFLRRVSHSVRHARSHSDRGTRLSGERKWPKSPLVGSGSSSFAHEISSPTASSPESKEEIVWYKNELRRERQKTLEKEQRLVELEVALEAKTSIKQMNTELREKRSTMVVLDTQKEIVVRELEVLTEHIASAKKSDEPLDIGKLSNAVLREFAESLQKLKDSFAPQIEDLTQRRNEIMEETSNLSELKEKSFQEFEQLSLKNAQLADLNNQLVHQIQELHKVNSGPAFDVVRPSLNGLGIYTHHQKEKSNTSMDSREPRSSLADSILTGSTVVQEHEVEPATYLTAPQVVNIRKAQPKKFNWKKGGHNVAKGVTKGLKGAFSSDGNRNHREGQYPEGIPYGAMQQPSHEYPISSLPRNQVQDRREGFGGIFGNPKTRPQQWKNSSNSSFPAVNSDGGMALFGSELEQRAEYERVNIPGIVMRCIQEVDARGMDIEGIYRKSGGNSLIQGIKEGFERSNDFDISDPDLDINAVTSTLKQYFRKLPTPLITYEVYDKLLDILPQPGQDIDPSHPAHHANPNNHIYRVNSMRNAINELPSHHRDTLEVLVFHLARVVEQQAENLMTSANVAVVFAPTVMRPESLAREMQDTQAKNGAVQFLIENCQSVFMNEG